MENIRLLFMDVDGTLTDGKIYMGNEGEICKVFNIKDGYGVHKLLPQYNITPVIITARKSGIVKRRCEELDIMEVHQNCRDKRHKLIEVAAHYGIKINSFGILKGVAYIGDDLLDLPCMELAEYSACPADASEAVRQKADFVSKYDGGNGAVREFIEWLVIC